VTFEFQQDGALPRELLKVNVNIGQNGVSFDQDFAFDPVLGAASQFRSSNEQDTESANARLEYERPFGEEQFLSTGLSFDMSETDIVNARETLLGPAMPPDYVALLEGRQQTLA